MANHSAMEVAKWFLATNKIYVAEEGAELISNMKLQKLLYYAQGSFLAVTGEPLFDAPIMAWAHGPVVEEVYHAYKEYVAKGIEFDEAFNFNAFSPEENNLLQEVYSVFGQYSAWKLRNMTHNETPWLSTAQNAVIDQAVIKDYFEREYLGDG